jgi:hypothetical protein
MDELTDEAMCVLSASGDRIAEESLVMRYNRLVRVCARPFFWPVEMLKTLFRKECSDC